MRNGNEKKHLQLLLTLVLFGFVFEATAGNEVTQLKTGDHFEYNGNGYTVVGENLIENPDFDNGLMGWMGGDGNALGSTTLCGSGGIGNGAYILPYRNDGKTGNGSIGMAWEIEKGKSYVFSYFVNNTRSTAAVEKEGYIVTSQTDVAYGANNETMTIMYGHEDADGVWTQNLIVTEAQYTYLQFAARWLAGDHGFDAFVLAEVEQDADPTELIALCEECTEWLGNFDEPDEEAYGTFEAIIVEAFTMAQEGSEEHTAAEFNAMIATLSDALLDFRIACADDNNPVDVTSRYIKNPDFGNGLVDWERNYEAILGGANIRVQSYFQETPDRVLEIQYPTQEVIVKQAIQGLPKGNYTFSFECVMTHSADMEDSNAETGAWIFCNGAEQILKTESMTQSNATFDASYPQRFEIQGVVAGTSIVVGLRVNNEFSTSYIAIDNLKLKYTGFNVSICLQVLTEEVRSFLNDNESTLPSEIHGNLTDLLMEAESYLDDEDDVMSEWYDKLYEGYKQAIDYLAVQDLITQANAFITSNPTIQYDILTVLQEQIDNPTNIEILRNALEDFKSFCNYVNLLRELVTQMSEIEELSDETTAATNVLNDVHSTLEELKLAYEQYYEQYLALDNAPVGGQQDGNIYWKFNKTTKTLTLWGTGDGIMNDYYYSNNPPWYSFSQQIQTVIVLDGVTSIGDDAFSRCSSLTSITLPDGVTSIGDLAFDGCSSLASITLPDGVTSIGGWAFCDCSSLTSITLSESVTSIEEEAFSGCSNLKVVFNNSALNITKGSSSYGYVGYYATIVLTNGIKEEGFWVEYQGEDKIAAYYEGKDKDVTIPDGITIIGDYAFSGSNDVISVTIPNSVTSIGNYAFSGCSLYSVTIGAKVSSIGSNCFSTKPKKTIWLCNTPPTNYTNAGGEVNYVANDQFSGLTNVKVYPQLSSLFVVDGIKYAIVSASERTCDAIDCVYDSTSANITIGETATYKKVSLKVKSVNDYTCYGNSFIQNANVGHEGNIGKNAFYDCDGLKTANINNNGSIGEYAFYSCNDLQAAEIGDGVSAIYANAFRNSMSLASVTLGSSIGTIGDYAFSGCTSLGSIVIPNSTTTLGNYCFAGNSKLASITLGSKVSTISTYAFQNCVSLPSISIPQSVATIGNYTFSGCSALKNITIEDRETAISLGSNGSNPLFAGCPLDTVFIGGKLSYQTGSRYGYSPFRNNTSLKSVIINDRETTIYDREFEGCSGLQSVILGNGVTNIGNYAYSGCTSLESIVIPNSTTTLGSYCFSGDNSLADITLGSKVNAINTYAFQNCSALPTISIPQSVATIGNYTFSGCSALKEVVIEDRMSTLSLGSNGSSPLFANCPLDSVYIGGKISYNKTSSYGYSPFYRNLTLRAVTITDEEETIYDNEFYGCSALSTVAIGDGVKTIGNWAFSGCSSLDYFAFGTSVESIGNEAFSDCTAVTSIISRAMTPPTCGSEALDDIDKWECTLFVPEGYTDTYMAADQWKDFFFVEERDITDTYSTTLAAEYGTWIVPVDADIPEGLTVYSCTSYDGTALELTAVSSIEANKPYIVEGTPGETYSVTGIPRHSDDLTDGLLTGTYFSTEVTSGYVLQDGAEGVGFYRVGSHAITLSPNRCYLNLPAGSAPMFRIGGTTQIVNVGETQDDIVYDLFGRRVTDMNAKGVFIRNGKKIYVK